MIHPSTLSDAELAEQTILIIGILMQAIAAKDGPAQDAARQRVADLEIETIARQIAKLQAAAEARKSAAKPQPLTDADRRGYRYASAPRTGFHEAQRASQPRTPLLTAVQRAAQQAAYAAFCARCESCRNFQPCSHAMNTTLACPSPGKAWRGFAYEAAA